MTFAIRDCETGHTIEECETLEEARRILCDFEHADREDGVYTPDFYEIYDLAREEVD